MKQLLSVIISLVFLFSFIPETKKIRIFMAGDSTMSVKEPRAFPETGWGMPFAFFWDESVQVINLAKNGRSTKSFRKEGLWHQLLEQVQEGDYVFIQFGHNDEAKEKGERYAPPDTFKLNLMQYIRETRSKNAIPVLLSPVSRRKFDREGKAMETHAAYTPLVAEVARETGVYYIDLDTKSRELYQQFGPESSRLLFLQLKPGEHPNYPQGKEDNTHLSELGARLIAQLVWKDVQLQLPELYSHTRNLSK